MATVFIIGTNLPFFRDFMVVDNHSIEEAEHEARNAKEAIHK